MSLMTSQWWLCQIDALCRFFKKTKYLSFFGKKANETNHDEFPMLYKIEQALLKFSNPWENISKLWHHFVFDI